MTSIDEALPSAITEESVLPSPVVIESRPKPGSRLSRQPTQNNCGEERGEAEDREVADSRPRRANRRPPAYLTDFQH